MKRFLFISIVLLVFTFLFGCSMDFLGGADDDDAETCAIHYIEEDTDLDGLVDTKYAYDCNDTLLWREAYEYDDESRKIGTRRYLPNDSVKWTELYAWDGDHQVLECYYLPVDGGHELQWYTRSSHDSVSGDLELMANYDDQGDLQWCEGIEYSATGKELRHGRFDGDGYGQWLYEYSYDGEDRKETKEEYAPTLSPSTEVLTYDDSTAVSPDGETHAFALALPSELAPLPVMPDLERPTDYRMELSSTQRWWYYAGGLYSAKYDAFLKPLLMTVEEEHIDEVIEISVGYNDDDLPIEKVTRYGDVEALRLGFEYRDDGFISGVSCSGASLLLPLDFEIVYDGSNVPDEITVSSNDTLLQSFEYKYTNTDGGAASLSLGEYMDPISFGGMVASITQRDGDGTQVGSYVFDYEGEDEVRIQAFEYDPEEESSTPGGYFLISLDAEGRSSSFSSYTGDDELLWRYDYSYDDLENRVKEARYEYAGDGLPEGLTEELSIPESFDPQGLFAELFLE